MIIYLYEGDFMGFNFKKKYGQNFLIDKVIPKKIVDSLDASLDDLIIEIGPGAGVLTKLLKNKNYNIICYEIDQDCKRFLDELEDIKLKVIYDDILNRDIKKDIKDYNYNNIYIIGNIPYYITTPIINKFVNNSIKPKEMVFMVQDEVANRLSANVGTKEYGSLSVYINFYYNVEKLLFVDKLKFNPVPNVDSAVVKFILREKQLDVDINKFNNLVKDAFQFKRKNLRNNLKKYDLDKINSILIKHSLSLNNRAEDLSYEIFIDIANNY